ncbi:MAG: DUF697 domain-containing protein [Prevotella sp.]|nr:DUF697 domain-containing protein [Prevotella sp.]
MKKVLILTLALFITISVVVILGNVIIIGEKFTSVFGTPYIEYVFYLLLIGLIAFLVYYTILEPMKRIHNAPEFPVLAIEDKEEAISDDEYRKRLVSFGKKICDNCYYLNLKKREAYQTELKTEFTALSTCQDTEQIKAFLNKELKERYKAVDRQIMKYSSKVFIITAISSNSLIDTLATMGLNYRMIADIVRSSGFRPNKLQLVKMYYYVICSAFFSYFFQGVSDTVDGLVDSLADASDMDVTDVEVPDFDASTVDYSQYVKSLNIPGIPLGPLADGLANAVMTIAIGYIAKYYLQKGSKELKGVNGRRIKLKAKMKALSQIPKLLVEVPEHIGSSGLSWVMKGFDKAYEKMAKKKYPDDTEVFKAMDDYDNEGEPIERKPKKKGIFNFWKW